MAILILLLIFFLIVLALIKWYAIPATDIVLAKFRKNIVNKVDQYKGGDPHE